MSAVKNIEKWRESNISGENMNPIDQLGGNASYDDDFDLVPKIVRWG